MATAPRPGIAKREERRRLVLRISDGTRKIDLHVTLLGPRDSLVCRQQTGGIALRNIIDAEQFDADSILILWWIARRKNGEGDLAFDTVLSEYPTYESLEAFEVDELNADEEDDGSPEA